MLWLQVYYLLLSLKSQRCVFCQVTNTWVSRGRLTKQSECQSVLQGVHWHHPCSIMQLLLSRSFLFPHSSPASKANIPLILRRRSIMENVLCGIQRPGICVLALTTCRILITTCAAKHYVRFTIFWEFVMVDHVYHRTTAGQVEQHCHITLQHRLEIWSVLISWTVLLMFLQPPTSSQPLTLQMDHNSYRRHPKAQVTLHFFLCSMMRSSGVPRNFVWGGGSTNPVEDRGQRERGSGSGSPLVRGSGGSCNLVQEISFHMVKFS